MQKIDAKDGRPGEDLCVAEGSPQRSLPMISRRLRPDVRLGASVHQNVRRSVIMLAMMTVPDRGLRTSRGVRAKEAAP